MRTTQRRLRALVLGIYVSLLAFVPMQHLSHAQTLLDSELTAHISKVGITTNLTQLTEISDSQTNDSAALFTEATTTPFVTQEYFLRSVAMYRYYATQQIPFTIKARIGEEVVSYTVKTTRRNQQSHIFVLLPASSHNSAAIDHGVMGGDSYASTYISPDSSIPTISAVEKLSYTYKTNGVQENYNALAIEMCQSYLSVEGDGYTLTSSRWRLAQEIVCNSIGRAVASSLSGATYDIYTKNIDDVGLLTPRQGLSFSLFSIDRKTFESVATITSPNTVAVK